MANEGAQRELATSQTRRGFLGQAGGAAGALAGALSGATSLTRTVFGDSLGQVPETIKIVSALPLTGSAYVQSSTMVAAIRMAIEEVERRAGPFVVEYEPWDDATAAAGQWDPAKVAELANRAAGDTNVMIYIGHYNSGAAKIAIPVLNQAGLVMISPANTYPALTKPGKGDPGEPEVYYPMGVRNYSRVVPADDLQGAVGASFAQRLGARSVFVIDDTQLYGKGIADVFAATAQRLGMTVAGRDGIDYRAADFRALATRIRASRPDVVYFGGTTETAAGKLIKDIRGAGISVPFIVPDGVQNAAYFSDAGDDAEGTYASFGGLPVSAYDGAQAAWAQRYRDTTGTDPQPYAIYAYEAAKVALAAIERAGVKDREAIRQAVMTTRDFSGVLGTWSFDDNGDTSLTTMSISQAQRGQGGQWTWGLVEVLEAPA
jgi:branched-chain amino acid transport system substrate-binding protein